MARKNAVNRKKRASLMLTNKHKICRKVLTWCTDAHFSHFMPQITYRCAENTLHGIRKTRKKSYMKRIVGVLCLHTFVARSSPYICWYKIVPCARWSCCHATWKRADMHVRPPKRMGSISWMLNVAKRGAFLYFLFWSLNLSFFLSCCCL